MMSVQLCRGQNSRQKLKTTSLFCIMLIKKSTFFFVYVPEIFVPLTLTVTFFYVFQHLTLNFVIAFLVSMFLCAFSIG